MTKITQAVVLAGGLGTRLKPLTDHCPKPMVRVNGKPFLEYLVTLLKRNGIEEIVLLLGHLPEQIMDYFGDGTKFGVCITYSVTPVEDETGTRIMKAKELLQERFLLLYADNYWPLDLGKMWDFYRSRGTLASVTVYTNKDHFTKNNMLVDKNGLVKIYDKGRTTPGLNGVDIGFFILEKKICELFPSSNFSFEKEIFPKLIATNELAGHLTDERYYSLSTIERFPETEAYLAKLP